LPGQLLTAQELSEELGVRLSTIYYWSHIGFIPTIKLGRLIRFRRSSVLKWLEKMETKGRATRKNKNRIDNIG
jgi:excisionase family DNA binding protein